MNYILKMRQVKVDRGARKNVLNIQEFAVQPGELIAVVGPNGAGKSTLLQVINLLQPYQGELQLFGQDASRGEKISLRRRCAMVFQETLLLRDTVFNNVAWPLKFRGIGAVAAEPLVYKALADFRCDHLASRPARFLSGGEAQRVCLARALVTAPELLLLDEPFAALDTATRGQMLEEIRQVAQAKGIAVILVSHNFSEVLYFADRAIAMFNGCVVQDGKPVKLMRQPANEQVAKLADMDNIIPCCSEVEGQQRYLRLADGLRFLYPVDTMGPITACCLPGDAFDVIADKSMIRQETKVVIEGVVDRILPGVGTYLVVIKWGEQILKARVPRELAGKIQGKAKIALAFNPADVHVV